jgi:cytoskeletal protein CcmA (bactofilin family)
MSVLIERNMRINGDLTAAEDLTVDCVFDGSMELAGHHLTIAPGSRVHATVSAGSVTVQGHFEGQIEADVVRVTTGSRVDATVTAKTFTMQDGAVFSGSVNTERARAAAEVARHRAAQRT